MTRTPGLHDPDVPFPTDPTPVFYDGTGAPIYQWAEGHECRDCDGPDHPCDTCLDDLADSEAERWADGRRDER